MLTETSGLLYCFRLDHNLGYGFAEYYDFSDIREFDGRFLFIYNHIEEQRPKSYEIDSITASGVAIGPLALYKPVNTRGIGAWKLIGKQKHFFMDEWPTCKDLRGNPFLSLDWSTFDKWFIVSKEHDPLNYVPYEQVRRLEQLVLTSQSGAIAMLTMKRLIDSGENITNYYDLSNLGNMICFQRLINTYYPLETTRKIISQPGVELDYSA